MNETNDDKNLPSGPTGETVAKAALAGSEARPSLLDKVASIRQDLSQRPEPAVTIGRQVLFQQHEGVFHTALVCKVWDNEGVNLKVTDENGDDYVVRSCNKGTDVGEWSFPKRV